MYSPRKKKSSRTDLQQYHLILGNLPRLVKRSDPAAQENFDKNNVLAGSRRSTDKNAFMLNLLWTSLSRREQEVTVLVCEGMTDAEIAERLYIGIATVKTYLQRVFYKTNVRDRRELMRKFIGFNFRLHNSQE